MDAIDFIPEIIWFAIVIIAVAVEILTFNLVSIWFAIGAIACVPISMLGLPINVQITVFLIISCGCLIGLRPWAKKHFHPKEYRTMVGTTCQLLEDCGPDSGKVKIGDVEWLARSSSHIPKGTIVKVIKIEGVKLIVEEE